MKITLCTLLVSLISLSAFSSDLRIIQSQSIFIEYFDDSRKIDRDVSIRVRDVQSQKMAQITLQKIKGEEKIWEGFLSIQFFKGDKTSRTLEFSNLEDVPFYVYFFSDGNLQSVKLFNSKELLERFLKKNESFKLPKGIVFAPSDSRRLILPPPSTTPIVMPLIEGAPIIYPPDVPASSEELEAKKRAEIFEREARLTEEQKAQKRQVAVQLAKRADAYYQRKDFSSARKLYEEALAKDPENQSYLYRYAVSLYKVEEFEKALMNLAIAEVPENLLVERDYFSAMSYLKLKEYDKALKGFREIRDENNPELSPTASFLGGTIEYQRQDFASARKSMEYVLDYSNDPKMDTAAEDMIEQIDRMESFLASKKEKFRFTFFAGPSYDQNILNIASNNIATDVQAVRATYGVSALGILFRSVKSNLGAQASFSDYYSTNTMFQPNATLQAADPMQVEFTIPFHQEFSLGSRTINWDLVPSSKSIMMSATGGSRQEVIRSVGASTNLSSPLSRDYFLSGKFEYSSDTSLLPTSVGVDDQTGIRYSFVITPTKLLDLKGERALSTDFSYLVNQSEGVNFRYKKLGIAVAYSTPFYWSSTGTLKLEYTNQNYGDAVSPRTDSIYSLSGGLTKKLSNHWSFMSNIQYSLANSDLDLYRYNKIILMGLFSYTLSIQAR